MIIRPTNDDAHVLWGARGHSMVNTEAVRVLPDDMPDFFRAAGQQLEAMASQPDRWKFQSLPYLQHTNRPDHWMDTELVAGQQPLPSKRYEYTAKVAEPQHVGFLPYAISETFEKLEAEMALWRNESAKHPESPLTHRLADNCIYTAGLLGHYVGDASQPLHTTVHADGWDDKVEPNPEHFPTERGVHAQFETKYVNAAVAPDALQTRTLPARVQDGDIFDLAQQFIAHSHERVRPLYRLLKEGKLDPERPHERGTEFTVQCLADGAQMLRDLWYTAWVRSEQLAKEAHDPD